MSDLKEKANGRDPFVINGNLKTTFKRVTGSTKLDRMIARNNMKKAGLSKFTKKGADGESYFAKHWREWVY